MRIIMGNEKQIIVKSSERTNSFIKELIEEKQSYSLYVSALSTQHEWTFQCSGQKYNKIH